MALKSLANQFWPVKYRLHEIKFLINDYVHYFCFYKNTSFISYMKLLVMSLKYKSGKTQISFSSSKGTNFSQVWKHLGIFVLHYAEYIFLHKCKIWKDKRPLSLIWLLIDFLAKTTFLHIVIIYIVLVWLASY